MAAAPCPSHTAMVRSFTQDRLTAMSISLPKATAASAGDAVRVHYDDASALTLLDDEAFSALRAAFERAPDDLTVLRHLVDAALLTARFVDALSLCAAWDELSPNRAMPYRGTIEALVEATASGHFTENGARSILRCASTVRREHQARLVEAQIKPSPWRQT